MLEAVRGYVAANFLMGVATLTLALPACAEAENPRSPTNVLLISIDTLRADHLGCYGYERNTSPNIDRLARRGTLFRKAIAPRAQTWPSLASVMTSLPPVKHGVRRNGILMKDEHATLALELGSKGYKTAAVLSNSWQQSWPGFEVVERSKDREVTRRASEWLHKNREGPFFLWAHYMTPHRPYKPRPPFDTMFADPNYAGKLNGSTKQLDKITKGRVKISEEDLRQLTALYDGEIAWVDREVGTLIQSLEASGRLENTLIVLTSDHGEELYQHNSYLFHSKSIYESALHVPLIWVLPRRVPEGKVVETLAEVMDIAPSILELVGVEAPGAFEGRSLVSDMSSWRSRDRVAVSEWEDKALAVRTPRYSYIFNPTAFDQRGFVLSKKSELYDLREDPKELDNVADKLPKVVKEMEELLHAWREDSGWKLDLDSDFSAEVAKETKARLRALGYID